MKEYNRSSIGKIHNLMQHNKPNQQKLQFLWFRSLLQHSTRGTIQANAMQPVPGQSVGPVHTLQKSKECPVNMCHDRIN